ncbi:hypothetical protein DSO57_1022183 [Entomophthora muscae]|uniref:Uncharacterized protein n=1 Tax=Entomophthora muscae TaxID=34485 RepID=A0ACC2TQD8_9FUNG|nr:hypothetical protein DSO57_1022183 [Entomophthora muscae]
MKSLKRALSASCSIKLRSVAAEAPRIRFSQTLRNSKSQLFGRKINPFALNAAAVAMAETNSKPTTKVVEYEFLGELDELKMQTGSRFRSLAIFDFDQTLFRSPLPNPNLWDTVILGLLLNGFFSWFETLEALPADLYKSNFIPSSLARLQSFIADETCMTVVLTGRKRGIFRDRIKEILSQKGLVPDLLILNESELSTFNFKELFISKLVRKFPSIRRIDIFDDREPHIKRFQTLVTHLEMINGIEGSVYHVVAKPSYLPEKLEDRLVREMILKRKQYPIEIKKLRGEYPVGLEVTQINSFLGIFLDDISTSVLLDTFSKHAGIPEEWELLGDNVRLSGRVQDGIVAEGWLIGQTLDLEVVSYSLNRNVLVALVAVTPSPEFRCQSHTLPLVLAFNPAIRRPKSLPPIDNWTTCRNTPLNLTFPAIVKYQSLTSLQFIYPEHSLNQ